MTEATATPSGSEAASTSGVDATATIDTKTETTEETVTREAFNRVLGETKKEREKRRELETQLQKLIDEKKSRETKELEDQNQFKKLWKQAEEEKKKLLDDAELRAQEDLLAKKYAAIVNALDGKIKKKIFYPIVEYSGLTKDVIVNPDTGDVDEMSVTKVVEKIRAEYPETLQSARPVGLPNESPQASTNISYEEWLKLPADQMAKTMKQVMENDQRRTKI